MAHSFNECRTVVVATDTELLSEYYYHRLWQAVRNKNVHRRDWLDELADAFLVIDSNIKVIWPSGEPYDLPEVDDIFPDLNMRWLSEYLATDVTGTKPKIQSRMCVRLRLLDLYFRVKHPRTSCHFYP